MTNFELIVIGGGTGNNVASAAARSELDVALVEKGPLGGTCLTRGCDPSKTLIHRADVIEQIRQAEQFGIDAEVTNIDFSTIISESNKPFDEKAEQMENSMQDAENLMLYKAEGRFVDERTLQVDDEQITGEKIVVAAGARPIIPNSIDGIEDVNYMTSDEVLRLDERPEHLIIIGGGYIAAEIGHAYGTLGSDVTIIGRSETLLSREDTDIRQTFTEYFSQRYDVHTGYEATSVFEDDDEFTVQAETDDGDQLAVTGDQLLVATGRKPNSDVLQVEKAGIATDDDGFIEANDYLETTADNVWAMGDIVGNYMFWHSALHEAEYVYKNAVHDRQQEVDYTGMSRAVFSSPQVASMGQTEQELAENGREYVVGTYEYSNTAMGIALKDEAGFVKVLAEPNDKRILGCHILGPDASTLIHEVVTAVTSGTGTVSEITDSIHIHPALNEVVERAFKDV